VVVGGGLEVVVSLGAAAGLGGGELLSPPPFPPPPPMGSQEPDRTPTDSGAKKVKRPVDMSRPPEGHPGHSSIMVAVAVLPLTVMLICWKQLGPGEPPPYWAEFNATIKSPG
jgi:hypothetical protein